MFPRSNSRILCLFVYVTVMGYSSAFTLQMMGGGRRGKGELKQRLVGEMSVKNSNKNTKNNKSAVASLNQGRGQEITGVSLPAEGQVKGWEFGENQRIACANVDGNFYAVQGTCPRCGFDLFKGDIVTSDAFEDLPRIACPTCATTYGLRTGKHGAALKRTGLAGFVGGLAKTATVKDSQVDAKAFMITRDKETGRVFMRER